MTGKNKFDTRHNKNQQKWYKNFLAFERGLILWLNQFLCLTSVAVVKVWVKVGLDYFDFVEEFLVTWQVVYVA